MEVLSQVFTPSNVQFMLKGLGMSVAIAGVSIVLSLIFGTLLGVGKTYGSRGVRGIISVYIEIFRTTPNLLWILVIYFMVPFPRGIDEMTKNFLAGVLAFTLFTSAVIAEIIRGGLNSVPKGQLEAAESQGFSFSQSLRLIVLPQALRASVPALLSQMITIVKDTSLLAGVNVAEMTVNARIVMGQFTSSEAIMLIFLFMAAVYFIIDFSLSLLVRRMQKQRVVKNVGAEQHPVVEP